jgi:hypothetical protein
MVLNPKGGLNFIAATGWTIVHRNFQRCSTSSVSVRLRLSIAEAYDKVEFDHGEVGEVCLSILAHLGGHSSWLGVLHQTGLGEMTLIIWLYDCCMSRMFSCTTGIGMSLHWSSAVVRITCMSCSQLTTWDILSGQSAFLMAWMWVDICWD